ncbi:MAG: VanW family protein [Thermoleophilia bacterium]|nr:VanW family protein [Thermoleophilia bacterium]MDH4338815.1 VanW family protein [Thermoleophilia bacterium]MDH5279601.1 VanW family protein [Thermoleophilia bacterium]
MRADSPILSSTSRRRSRSRSTLVTAALGIAGLVALAVLVGLAYAGSSRELAAGTQVAGVDVGGLSRQAAVSRLNAQFQAVSEEPVAFTAGAAMFMFAANQLAVQPDWGAAVAAAGREGDGFGPIRGLRRLHTRFFGAEVLPRLAVSDAALEFALDGIETQVEREARDAALVRRGLRIETVPERAGARLEREPAAEVIVRALGQLDRSKVPVALPIAVAAPNVTAEMLVPAARRVRTAIRAPVFLKGAGRSWRLPRRRLAALLELPSGGVTRITFAGVGADAYFRALAQRVGKPATDAGFAVSGESVQVIPARDGLELDVPATASALLRAALRPANRVAQLQVVRAAPERTTSEALAMGIDRRMASYKTYYSGTADRITNLQLGVRELDGTLVPPGGTFSLNEAIGERTVERGFRPAPVIIGTEFAEEVGGGTSQIATTAFNAAWEAGLRITERNPHSLYISRYQLGRDATVYWPSLDLKFVNDTKSWVLVKGFAESDGISIAIFGGEDRRVESSPGTFTVTGRPPIKRVKDPTLAKGKTVVEEEGSAPSRTSVTRTVYAANGSILRDETWTTSYKGETRIVRVGTKVAKPKAKAPVGENPKPPAKAGATPPPTQP